MSTTIANLQAVIGVDTAAALYNLNQFGTAFDMVKTGLSGVFEPLQNALKGVTDFVISGVRKAAGFAKDTLVVAFGEVSQYEMLETSVRQLIASQLLSAGAAADMTEALVKAQRPADEFLGWMEQIALKSAYGLEGVSDMARQVMAFGFGVDETKRFTEALIDFSTAAGVTPEGIQRISMSLGQMVARGKITGEELRELSRQMIPATSVLAEEMGIAAADMEKQIRGGAVSSGEALEMLVGWMERTYSGARELGATTFTGMTEAVGDIKSLSLRNLFTGMFEEFKPAVTELVSFLSGEEFQGTLQKVGQGLGDAVRIGLEVGGSTLSSLVDTDDLGSIKEFIESIKSGDYVGTIGQLIGSIEFGVMSAAVQIESVGKQLFAVGEYVVNALKVFISELGDWLSFTLGSGGDDLRAARRRMGDADLETQAGLAEYNAALADIARLEAQAASARKIDLSGLTGTGTELNAEMETIQTAAQVKLAAIDAKKAEFDAKIKAQSDLREKEANEARANAAAAARYGGVSRAEYEGEVSAVIGLQNAFAAEDTTGTKAQIKAAQDAVAEAMQAALSGDVAKATELLRAAQESIVTATTNLADATQMTEGASELITGIEEAMKLVNQARIALSTSMKTGKTDALMMALETANDAFGAFGASMSNASDSLDEFASETFAMGGEVGSAANNMTEALDQHVNEALGAIDTSEVVPAVVNRLEGEFAHIITALNDQLVVPLAELPVGIQEGDRLKTGMWDDRIHWAEIDRGAVEDVKSKATTTDSTEAADALLKSMVPSEGVTVDGAPYVDAMLQGVTNSVAASAELFKSAGKQVWASMSAGIEAGFAAGAAASGTFRSVIEGMVNASLAGILSE